MNSAKADRDPRGGWTRQVAARNFDKDHLADDALKHLCNETLSFSSTFLYLRVLGRPRPPQAAAPASRMNLRKIQIENFRGIKNLELELDALVVLIGENNTGKTSILQALRLCLRDLAPRGRLVFDPLDFHLVDGAAQPSTAPPISVTLTFGEMVAGDWNEARTRRLKDILHVDETGLTWVVVRVTCAYDSVDRDFRQGWEFLNATGAPLPSRGDAGLNALQREIAFYLLDALRDAARNFDAKGPFWRPFLKDSQLTAEKTAEIEQKLRDLNELVVSSHGTFAQARGRLKKVQEIVPMHSGDVVSVEAVPGRIFDMLARAQVHLGTTTGANIPVGRHGEGTQSLAVLMLFAAFLELDAGGPGKTRTPLIALEEPEAHLHPSAVRTLWRTLEGIPGQKLISTHSGDLLSQVPVASLRRLARTAQGVEVFRLKSETLTTEQQRMFDFHVRHARGELLFARCWLMGEGETEVTLFQEIVRHLGIDLEHAGVRCVPYRGASIELFLKVAKDFGIRWCVLTDDDDQGKADQRHVTTHTDPTLIGDALHVIPEGDIETHLCGTGFGAIYEAYLTHQTRDSVTVAANHPDYWKQVLKAIGKAKKFRKPDAALQVARRIQEGTTEVPPLLKAVVEKAVELAGGM